MCKWLSKQFYKELATYLLNEHKSKFLAAVTKSSAELERKSKIKTNILLDLRKNTTQKRDKNQNS